MKSRSGWWWSYGVLLWVLAVSGCEETSPTTTDSGVLPSPPVAVRVATWNLRNFPDTTDAPARFAEAIAGLDVDLIAVQEIEDVHAFEALVDALPGYAGQLGGAQPTTPPVAVGMLWREARLSLVRSEDLFLADPLFPRPVLRIDFGVTGTTARFSAVTAHLKAGTKAEDEQQRIDAASALAQALTGIEIAGEEEVLLLGDLNEAFGDPRASEFFGKFEQEPRYTVLTRAFEQSGEITFVPAGIVLDHLIASPGFQDEIRDHVPEAVRVLPSQPDAGTSLSDHRPVRLELTFEATP